MGRANSLRFDLAARAPTASGSVRAGSPLQAALFFNRGSGTLNGRATNLVVAYCAQPYSEALSSV